jgi:hypothetical protein
MLGHERTGQSVVTSLLERPAGSHGSIRGFAPTARGRDFCRVFARWRGVTHKYRRIILAGVT